MKDLKAEIWIINGPNLNLLGVRAKEIYGNGAIEHIEKKCREVSDSNGLNLKFLQSNHEGDLIDWVQDAQNKANALIINAGGYTHTSISLHDALETLTIPIYEVHISNIYSREPFRKTSYISPNAKAVIAGFGQKGYILALEDAINTINGQVNNEG